MSEATDCACIPGASVDEELFAAPVEYPLDLAGADGLVPLHLMWAALDCPSSFVMYMSGERPAVPYVLGRIAARIMRRPAIDTPLVACAWAQGLDGRKLFAAQRALRGRRARRVRPRHVDQRLTAARDSGTHGFRPLR